MIRNKNESICVLGIAPSSRGFGFAVMTDKNELVDWGVKVVKGGKKNERCLHGVANLIERYQPQVLGVENCSQNVWKGGRIKELLILIAKLGEENGLKVRHLTRKQVNLRLLRNERGTKHEVATHLATAHGDRLLLRLPPKRRLWQSEPYQMDIFAAVALAQCSFN